jgi:tripartite ATP-independent transporter DctM subunit
MAASFFFLHFLAPPHVREAAKKAAAEASKGGHREQVGIVWRSFLSAVPSLILVIVVLGGILGGLFSATEASAVAVAYCLILGMGFYREIKWSALPEILLRAAKTTSVVMLLVGASQAMSWVLAYEQIPQLVSEAMLALSANPLMIFLLINVLLLVVGTFMDMTPAVLIFTPIFLPVVIGLGMDPVHFGIVIIANLCIGLCTPPVGTCLFLGCSVGKTTIAKVVPTAIPFFVAMLLALLAITYIPWLSLALPRLLKLM